jgi:hypothetical protein
MTDKPRVCKDCSALDEPPVKPRPAPHPGPRCTTHHRTWTERSALLAHDAYIARTYGVPKGFYAALYDAQGGRCAICRWARGLSRKLAMDHDHSCCAKPPLCGKCTRGLLCGPCNQFVGWQAKDDPETFARGARYLREPIAQTVLIAFTEVVA